MYNSHKDMLDINAHLLLSGGLGPRRRAGSPLHHRLPLSSLGGPHGSGHPDPDFIAAPRQHNQHTRSRSTSRSNAPCHGFHDISRKINLPPPRTTWHGSSITAARNVANSIRSQLRRSARCSSTCPGSSGSSNAAHAFKRPRQRRHHHVRPVAHQVIRRRLQRRHAPLELRDDVLLVAATVRLEDQSRRPRPRGRW